LDEDKVTRRALDRFEAHVRSELAGFDDKLARLKADAVVEVFRLDAEMLHLCTALSYEKLAPEPFDQAILASILVRAKQILHTSPDSKFVFCELDSHLSLGTKTVTRNSP
jgi:hypothetical protein